MGQTSRYGFPYPEITDNANIPNDIKMLADKVEEIVDSTSYDMYKPDAGTVSNTYCLIAEYNIPGIYLDFSDTIILDKTWGNYGRLSGMIINVVGRFDDVNVIKCSVNYMTRGIDEIQFIALTNIINGVANIKLYVKSIAQYTIISAKSLDYKKTGNITRQYYKDQPNITELPSGTQVYGKNPGQLNGVLNPGETKLVTRLSGFNGFINIRMWADFLENFKIIAYSGANKYAKNFTQINSLEYFDNTHYPNMIATHELVDDPDSGNILFNLKNTGSVAVNYEVILENKL